jgi:CheY-like chemotaxis protein
VVERDASAQKDMGTILPILNRAGAPRARAASGPSASGRTSEGALSQLKLLVVDDDLALLRAFARTFGRRYQLLTVDSGLAALDALAAKPFDVVIVDFSMPVMSGVDLLRRVVAAHPDVGRVMLTGYAELSEIAALKAAQLVSSVLAKPWKGDDRSPARSRSRDPRQT